MESHGDDIEWNLKEMILNGISWIWYWMESHGDDIEWKSQGDDIEWNLMEMILNGISWRWYWMESQGDDYGWNLEEIILNGISWRWYHIHLIRHDSSSVPNILSVQEVFFKGFCMKWVKTSLFLFNFKNLSLHLGGQKQCLPCVHIHFIAVFITLQVCVDLWTICSCFQILATAGQYSTVWRRSSTPAGSVYSISIRSSLNMNQSYMDGLQAVASFLLDEYLTWILRWTTS